jgi:hypothetical protein
MTGYMPSLHAFVGRLMPAVNEVRKMRRAAVTRPDLLDTLAQVASGADMPILAFVDAAALSRRPRCCFRRWIDDPKAMTPATALSPLLSKKCASNITLR